LYSQKVLAETTATKRMRVDEPVLWCIGQNKIYGRDHVDAGDQRAAFLEIRDGAA
jgi:hypothetical protein